MLSHNSQILENVVSSAPARMVSSCIGPIVVYQAVLDDVFNNSHLYLNCFHIIKCLLIDLQ